MKRWEIGLLAMGLLLGAGSLFWGLARAARPDDRVTRAAVAAVVALLLAGCARDRDLTAGEATEAANDQIAQVLPQMRGHLGGFEILTEDMGGKWRVTYGGGTGGIVVDVDKHSGQANIVAIEQ